MKYKKPFPVGTVDGAGPAFLVSTVYLINLQFAVICTHLDEVHTKDQKS